MNATPAVVMEGWENTDNWMTTGLRPDEQFDHWCQFVNQAFLRWTIARRALRQFPAFIREGRADGYRVSNLTSATAGIRGDRGRREIAHDSAALFNVLLVAEGSQNLILDERLIVVPSMHFVLWDSQRPMTFVTGGNLRQITLAIPHERLLGLLPNAREFVGQPIAADSGLRRLFAEHLTSLEAHFGNLPVSDAPRVLGATLDLLIATLDATVAPRAGTRQAVVLRRAQAYINEHLCDPTLNPAKIADGIGVTVRHLHRVFAGEETTVAAWMLQRRLEHCRQDLLATGTPRRSITNLALRWGFADSSTFCKSFKRAFGLTPSAYRAANLAHQ
ncbi:MAG: helix-turn-helix domain-containing protein [Gammaproteobacteria bacterium]